jgi:SPFH domain / Band 7 family
MLGFRFIKTEPTQYVIQYRNGRPVREGAGLAFWYFAPSTSMIVVPTASVNEPFIFPEITSDFQEVTIQGQITYRVTDPRRTAALLNFTFGPKGSYVSEDPKKLSQRLINQVQVAMRAEVQALSLKQVLASGEPLVERVAGLLQDHPTVKTLGLELLGLSLLAVKPRPETAKALEAEAREALLRRADEAIYTAATPPSNRNGPSRRTNSRPRSRLKTKSGRSVRPRWRRSVRSRRAGCRCNKRK